MYLSPVRLPTIRYIPLPTRPFNLPQQSNKSIPTVFIQCHYVPYQQTYTTETVNTTTTVTLYTAPDTTDQIACVYSIIYAFRSILNALEYSADLNDTMSVFTNYSLSVYKDKLTGYQDIYYLMSKADLDTWPDAKKMTSTTTTTVGTGTGTTGSKSNGSSNNVQIKWIVNGFAFMLMTLMMVGGNF
ncbi:hypothetical protein HDU76_005061 [Blyttiomyces sp. JEL0837]|nr:hypothetical protein HDU76_005061 [Blyttiomyces sp. JEL0837]